MKTIVVPTDLSTAAENAAMYAYHVATRLHANVKLFNTFVVPIETTVAPQVVWPLVNYDELNKESLAGLQQLADRIKKADNNPDDFNPEIEYCCEVGNTADLLCGHVRQNRNLMVIMGMSGAGGLSRFFLGSTSRDIIEKACFPVLLVPKHTIYRNIHKIAFATDLSKGDIEIIHSLAGFARYYNAEILISHITDDKYESEYQKRIDDFLNDITCKINYPKIYYRHIKSMDVDHGLGWITEHAQADIMAMVHRKHNLLERLFGSSHTQQLAREIDIPLFVFPEVNEMGVLPAF